MAKANSASILIVGTGALGCLFAARFASAGYPVQMQGSWPEGVATLQERGVTLVMPDGSRKSYRVQASAQPRDFAGAKFALVLVKAWQTQRAAEQLFDALAMDGIALTLQNGLGNRETLLAKLGAERVAYGVITTGATLLGPGEVRWAGEGQISLGTHARLAPLADALQRVGFKVVTVDNMNSVAWSKLVINAAINPLTALLGIPNGDLLSRPTARELSAALAREVAAVAAAKGIALTFADPLVAAEDVARRTAANLSSMLQDVRRSAPTEINAICGAVVQAGKESGVPTPVNEIMWKLVSALPGAA
ncbi:MAG: 2-dehydropantoate 2-reductase [Anaerolineales bacterium]